LECLHSPCDGVWRFFIFRSRWSLKQNSSAHRRNLKDLIMKKTYSMVLALVAGVVTISTANASPFADAVLSYEPGVAYTQGFTSPASALGEPSRVNPFTEATDPFNPPYGSSQVVSIGEGGSLTVRFQTPILNHPNNLFGYDFLIFGNSGFIITNDFDLNTFSWIGNPATDGSLFAANEGSTRVSVSRDGIVFYELRTSLAPIVDRLFPTDAAGDFHVPVAPQVGAEHLAGATLEGLREVYAGSGGGAAYDISWAVNAMGVPVRLSEINFVRVEVLTGKSEIDAFSAVARNVPGTPRGKGR
jgi:hypothetical protein